MTEIVWDRLLETALRRGATDLLLVPGSPPMLRTAEDIRAMNVPPLTDERIGELAEEMMSKKISGIADGYAFLDFRYLHDADAWFRVMAFGYPHTKLVVVMRLRGPDEAPANA
jgi:Tfp pilus assembly pilus retraction ATPase PilT